MVKQNAGIQGEITPSDIEIYSITSTAQRRCMLACKNDRKRDASEND